MPQDKEKERARQKAWFKRRYDSDPLFREKVRANGRKNYHANREKILLANRGKPAKRTKEGYEAHIRRAYEHTKKLRHDLHYRELENARCRERQQRFKREHPDIALSRQRAYRANSRSFNATLLKFRRGDISIDEFNRRISEAVGRYNAKCEALHAGGRNDSEST